MLLSSILFTFYFFPICLILVNPAKGKLKAVLLLIFSAIFYLYGGRFFAVVLYGEIILTWAAARIIVKNRDNKLCSLIFLTSSVIIIIGILCFFKFRENSLFPLGISFFSFRMLSYLFDIYRKKYEPQKLMALALYVSFFPQIISGPIITCGDFTKAFQECRPSKDALAEGFKRFLLGFCKKILLADQLAVMANEVFSQTDFSTTDTRILWIGSICYSLQLFYDFSGYTDMSLGICRMIGLTFSENFNYPYAAGSAEDFWRRWHISLSRWFRDYVYIPLGGSRVKTGRHILNLLIVWMLTGIWHGSTFNYIVWGIMYFVLLVLEKYLIHPSKQKLPVRIIWRVLLLFCVNIGWMMFRCPDGSSALSYGLSMLGVHGIILSGTDMLIRYFREFGIYLIPAIIFSFPVVPKLHTIMLKYRTISMVYTISTPIIYMCLFILALSFLITDAHHPFLYANF